MRRSLPPPRGRDLRRRGAILVLTVFFNYAASAVCAFGDGLESQHVVQREIVRKAAKAAKAAEKSARKDPTGPMSNL